jgi:hypothetical protein
MLGVLDRPLHLRLVVRAVPLQEGMLATTDSERPWRCTVVATVCNILLAMVSARTSQLRSPPGGGTLVAAEPAERAVT